MKKRVLSLALVLLLTVAVVPVMSAAGKTETITIHLMDIFNATYSIENVQERKELPDLEYGNNIDFLKADLPCELRVQDDGDDSNNIIVGIVVEYIPIPSDFSATVQYIEKLYDETIWESRSYTDDGWVYAYPGYKRNFLQEGTSANLDIGLYFISFDSGIEQIILVGDGGNSTLVPSSWAVEYVDRAKALGILPAAFQSNYTDNITRAEVCALVVALYETAAGKEITERKQFVDTTDINVQKVGALGIVTGVGNDKFDPNGTLTREQSAVILVRLAEKMGKKLPSATSTFSDNSKMSSWAIDAIGQIQQSGIMSGVGNSNFNPSGSYTREQSIITMVRIWDLIKG